MPTDMHVERMSKEPSCKSRLTYGLDYALTLERYSFETSLRGCGHGSRSGEGLVVGIRTERHAIRIEASYLLRVGAAHVALYRVPGSGTQ
jgi:hypothetical protein